MRLFFTECHASIKITLRRYVKKVEGIQGRSNIIRTGSKRDKAGCGVAVEAVGSCEHLTCSVGHPGQGNIQNNYLSSMLYVQSLRHIAHFSDCDLYM